MRDEPRSRFTVKVTPGAARASIRVLPAGEPMGPVAQIRVTAPPADGKANEAVVALLAGALGIAPRDLVLVSGAGSRLKLFEAPLVAAVIRERLAAATSRGQG